MRQVGLGLVISFLCAGCGVPSPADELDVEPAAVPEVDADPPSASMALVPVAAAPAMQQALALGDCGYSESDYRIAWCNGRYRNVWELSPAKVRPGCPAHRYRVGTHWYPTQQDALGAEQCESACLYRPAAAVMFVRCGQRDELTEYGATSECPALYGFSDGSLGTSVEQWEKDHPCP